MPERYLKVAEVAERLALGRSNCYDLIQRGILPGVRIGRAIRVPESKLVEYLESLAIAPATRSTR